MKMPLLSAAGGVRQAKRKRAFPMHVPAHHSSPVAALRGQRTALHDETAGTNVLPSFEVAAVERVLE